MALTPDEITRRPFTPSVDGYHQGEVRSFLERIAKQVQAINAASPEGRAELAELSMAMTDHEPRLVRLEQQLNAVVASLGAATKQTHETQTAAAAQLMAARQLTAGLESGNGGIDAATIENLIEEQRSLIAATGEQRALVEELLADRKATDTQLASVAEQLASVTQIAGEQQATTARLAATIDQLNASSTQLGESVQATAPVTPESFSAASAWALGEVEPPASHTDATDVIYTDPIDGTPVSASGGTASPALESDLDEDPLYSDNANDLLDGVLDDVMENLNDEGKPTS